MTGLRVIALGLTMAAMTSADASAQDSDVPDQTRPPSYFFVQSGKSLEVTSETITLVDARSKTTSITDRPDRIVDQLSNETFAARWDEGEDSFADDPPNAVVMVGGHRPVIVVLTDIAVSANRITYDYELLHGRFPYKSAPTTIVIDDAAVLDEYDLPEYAVVVLEDAGVDFINSLNCQNYASKDNNLSQCSFVSHPDILLGFVPDGYIGCKCFYSG